MIMPVLSKGRLYSVTILFFMISISLSGCSMSGYGQLKSNKQVKQTFETYQILPNHQYYYRGTYSRPFAIVGINENYTLNSKLWVQIDPKSEDFRLLIDRVALQGSGGVIEPWGFIILDHSGSDVGIWYSAIRAAAVKIDENGQIVNLAPLRAVAIGGQR